MKQIRFDKDKVVCISLISHDDAQLEAISEIYKISYNSMLRMKQNGWAKIWVEKAGIYLIAYTTIKNPSMLMICQNFLTFGKQNIDFLKCIKQVPTPKVKKKIVKQNTKQNKKQYVPVLDVDTILEKIFERGLSSISKEEKDFLDNESK